MTREKVTKNEGIEKIATIDTQKNNTKRRRPTTEGTLCLGEILG